MRRPRPKNKRGKYAFRELRVNELETYPEAIETALISALQSFTWSRQHYDPRYFVQFGLRVLRVKNLKTKQWLEALPAKERFFYMNESWRLDESGYNRIQDMPKEIRDLLTE